jgi:hypothetical protein
MAATPWKWNGSCGFNCEARNAYGERLMLMYEQQCFAPLRRPRLRERIDL